MKETFVTQYNLLAYKIQVQQIHLEIIYIDQFTYPRQYFILSSPQLLVDFIRKTELLLLCQQHLRSF